MVLVYFHFKNCANLKGKGRLINMTVLTKDQMKTIIAEKKGITKTAAEAYMKDVFETFEEILAEYQAGFQFGNVGKFEVGMTTERKARKGHNPQTGEEIDIKATPSHLGFKFKPSKGKESVWETLKNA